ncbi:DUF300-domain-containing protein [Rhizophagus clarus]|uniref:DUF300-domain-containing protein n=1 Tax=Rhizophagus clarus TaxID=94130 RepID=A0A8H3R0S8_9GLOM|nr:DUF300-domain-containing protein [Rhizophagus clarus]
MLGLSITGNLLTRNSDLLDGGGGGSGGSSENFRNPDSVRAIAALFAILATTLSTLSVWSHLKNYRKPSLQRYVVRIIIMVPIYAISSYISLASTSAAVYVDGIRDMYEAFVIYCFFNLLVNYLGGERSLLILLHGRPPTPHLFPVNIFIKEMDVGDPYTFFGPKLTEKVISKLKMDDLKPYRPVPKFLCVKAIIFFSFWQSFALSILVSLGIIHDTDEGSAESFSVSIQDFLITIEMLFAAWAHNYAFSYKDYIEPNIQSGRMPIKYAFKDCMGFKDVIEDTMETIRGSRFNYRTFEPAEGMAHIGPSRTARIMAGLRFTGGGAGKYWLPDQRTTLSSELDDDKRSLNFPDPDTDDEIEAMYEHSRKLGEYGDYNFPVIYSNTSGHSSRPKPKRKRTMSRRKQKGKSKAKYIFDTEESNSEEDIENGLNVKSGKKERQLSDLPPYRDGCVDLVREVSNGYGKRYESYADRLGTSLPTSSNKSTMLRYSPASMRDPFIQIPSNNTLQPLQINEVSKEETESDENNENDDPLRSNRASYLSTSIKSLEKNIWNDDIWKL